MKKIRKTVRKQGFFDDFFSILTVFRSLLIFGSIVAQKLNRFICKKIPEAVKVVEREK